MMTTFDTALLKHQPDHLRLPTEAERQAAGFAPERRISLRAILAKIFKTRPSRPRIAPSALADTRF